MDQGTDHGIRFGRIAATLPVKDMRKAQAFYAGVLGFKKVFENGDPVQFVILKRHRAELHLTLQRKHKPAPFNENRVSEHAGHAHARARAGRPSGK